MNSISEFDLMQSMSGPNIDGEGKCVLAIKQQRCNADGVLREMDDEFITEKPVVHIFKQAGGFVLVDLVFSSIEDKDLKIIYAYLDRFFSASNSVSDDEYDFPLLTFTFVPHAFDGAYWAIGLNPIYYGLTPEDSTGEPRIIRLVFMAQDDTEALPNFLFLASPNSALEDIMIAAGEDGEDASYI